MITQGEKFFYCQEDGGQWNVEVKLTPMDGLVVETETLVIVYGVHLISDIKIGPYSYKLVNVQDLHPAPLK